MVSLELVVSSFTVISLLFLSLLILSKNKTSITHRSFAVFSTLLALWAFANYFSLNNKDSEAVTLFWIRAVMLITSFLGPTLFVLFSVFPRSTYAFSKIKKIALITIALLPALFAFTPLMFSEVSIVEGVITPSPGPAIVLFAISFVVTPLVAFVLFLRRYFKSSGSERAQILIILIGLAISFLLYSITSFILVIVFNISDFVVFGPLSNLVFVGFTAYAIVRHQLLEIRFIIARTLTYLLLLGIFSFIYINWLLSISNWLSAALPPLVYITFNTALVLFIALTFYPLRRRIEKISNRLFFQYLPEENTFIQEVGDIVSQTLDMNVLAKVLIKKFTDDFQIEKAVFWVSIDDKYKILNGGTELSTQDQNTCLSYLPKIKNKVTVVSDIENIEMRDFFRRHYFSLVLRLTYKSDTLGFILLGDKKSGTTYYSPEVRLFALVVPTIAVALNNTIQFAKIQGFSETLKEKVKQATSKLREANQKLKDLDERKDEFLNVAAHELRAPLTAIEGYLSFILEGSAGNISGKLAEFVKGAYEGTKREGRLVNNLLNVSRIEEGRLVFTIGKVNLAKVVEAVYHDFKLEAEKKGLKMSYTITDDIKDLVEVDQDRIHEVVANLVSNAIKYTDRGSIKIRLFNPHDKNSVRFEITDTGYGISKEEQKKLFTKFYRSESSTGKILGTGLGLYIVKLLIEKFGGDFGVESEKGMGSTFWFELAVLKQPGKQT